MKLQQVLLFISLSFSIAATEFVFAESRPNTKTESKTDATAETGSESVLAAAPLQDSQEINQTPPKKNQIKAPQRKPGSASVSPKSQFQYELSVEDEALLNTMPLKQKIGQMLMIGFMGTDLERGLAQTITTVKPGALVVFGRNIVSARQISDLNLAAQRASLAAGQGGSSGSSGLPLLIAVDQEGGDVIRVRTTYPLPSALALGESRNSDLVERAGKETGILLRVLGFNMNLAPVLDVANPQHKSFIGTRTFGSDPKIVAKMGHDFSTGLESARILPTTKHFPGHGGVKEDSHRVAPEKTTSLDDMMKQDLVPFSAMAKDFHHPWAVMIAHIAYPSIDPSRMPATFSKPIVTDLLRKKLGFEGLVITDDIEMAGANVIEDVKERAIRAIEAGVDMIMIAWNKKIQRQTSDAIEAAVKSGRLPESRIDESVRRIIAIKRKYVDPEFKRPSTDELTLAVKNPAFKVIAEETLLSKLKKPGDQAENDFIAYAKEKPILLFSSSERFLNSFREGAVERSVRTFNVGTHQRFDIDRVMRSNPGAVGVFYVSGQKAAVVANKMGSDVASRMFIVTVETEGVLTEATRFKHIADVYYRHPDLGKFVAEHFFNSENSPVQPRRPASKRSKSGTQPKPLQN